MKNITEIMQKAKAEAILIPAFNVAHLPMTKPMIDAAADTGTFVLIEVSRIDWNNFGAGSLAAVWSEYEKYGDNGFTRLHLDHIPVIDENGEELDYMSYIREAVEVGYHSVMIDGSRLGLDENIAAAKEVCDFAHYSDIAVEAELGAVLGHESGPVPPYEELYSSGRGFTDIDEAVRFVRDSGCDWLSVAVGNIHGAVSGVSKNEKKPEARINLEHLKKLNDATGIPLVLHGGSGIKLDYVRASVSGGITKMNIGTDLRQTYEKALSRGESTISAQKALYDRCREILIDELRVAGKAALLV